ncbi:hypothetical protein [Aneurinibacillus migulanus]|uniref:Uncharacterized protein n=1 Tax=Aneurinibacillus migulanus TaxID=47500 RepID=A0A1G8T3M1_ANEMI|nr:hypothetical protein [Aneurinibacillus migulanus]MED0894407.1 hypothetical protein [Aneurinibacillus migulanus]MED1617017.1 hypothetical protein [Aneurinibacillus migulanus]GED17834.1 hypothetical protein AMI01nite_58250 [Aneurinibacillus migulanus]SDJ36239.1 hypothetical protein SAMN04487909_11677 [Aneurinibacillus migulanus]
MKNNETIKYHWKNNKLPGIEGIVYPSGKIIIMDFYEVIDNNITKFFINPVCETSIESVENFNADIWCEIEKHPQFVEHDKNLFICGEGSMGNEGFFANVDIQNNLVWAFFSTNSNPFYKLEIEEELLRVFTTSDLVFTLNINKPEEMKIHEKI